MITSKALISVSFTNTSRPAYIFMQIISPEIMSTRKNIAGISNPKSVRGKEKRHSSNKNGDLFWKVLSGGSGEYLLFFIATLLYIQTITHDYTMDDAIVITDNMFTTQGIKGIPGIFSYDTFYGFFKESGKEQLVSGGRYRPFTLAMFAMERTLFGSTPMLSHLINVLLFAFTCLLLLRLVKYLFVPVFAERSAWTIAFITALLFTVHPIHTEVVANIKGRDEIMSLLGCLLAIWFGLKWLDTKKMKWLFIAIIFYFIGLLSKENAVSLLVWFPAALFIFKKNSVGQSLTRTIPFVAIFVLFIIIRSVILKDAGFSGPLSTELLNNPFFKWENGKMVAFSAGEKIATIFYCLGTYIKLFIFPHPLTHDYYPRHISVMQFNNIGVIISVLLNISFFIGTIWLTFKRKILGYAGLLYWIPLLIVSNLFFPIGTNMGERFAYMSSIGFCLTVAYLIQYFFKNRLDGKMAVYFSACIALLFGIKTTTRNSAWENNLVLFETDIKTSSESAKLNNSIGSEYIKMSSSKPDGKEKQELINKGIQYLEKAINIHPLLKNSYLNLGNAQAYLNKYELAIDYYNKVLAIDPSDKDAKNNMTIAFRTIARQAGEKEGNITKSIEYLNKAYNLTPGDYETLRLLGVAHGIKGDNSTAISFFTKALELNSGNASANYDLGVAYKLSGNERLADTYINKAIQLNPNIIKERQEKK